MPAFAACPIRKLAIEMAMIRTNIPVKSLGCIESIFVGASFIFLFMGFSSGMDGSNATGQVLV